MKSKQDYKMSKPTKTMLALSRFHSKEARYAFKRMMIEAELIEKNSAKPSDKD